VRYEAISTKDEFASPMLAMTPFLLDAPLFVIMQLSPVNKKVAVILLLDTISTP